jgi:type I restriction enzyme M protein
MSDIVGKLFGFCHILRHDGFDYGDYIEQLTYLLFLKMAEEKGASIPKEYSWKVLCEKSGTELLDFYTDLLRGLAKQKGTLGDIYAGAVSRFNNPVNLKRLINLIDEIEWTSLNIDVKAATYEGLLEQVAAEGKKGAGQYFTPRILIQSIVRCMKPDPRKTKDYTIHDPAAGTGGFLVCAYEWLIEQTKGSLEREDAKRILTKTYSGTELVPRPRRLCLMNLYLHGINGDIYLGDSIYEPLKPTRYDCVLTNPPFGTKGANQAPNRDDFTVSTSNKQLNFVQHVMNILKLGGRAAIVLPDNVLFEEHAARDVFEILMEDCGLHTILRLPRGTFTPYSPGVKANVIFFTKGPKTENIWTYDARTNVPSITKKDRPLTPAHFADFERCFGSDPNGHPKKPREESERFRCFTREDIKKRNNNLDIFWLKEESLEDSEDLPEPEDLASEAAEHLQNALDELNDLMEQLEPNRNNNKDR